MLNKRSIGIRIVFFVFFVFFNTNFLFAQDEYYEEESVESITDDPTPLETPSETAIVSPAPAPIQVTADLKNKPVKVNVPVLESYLPPFYIDPKNPELPPNHRLKKMRGTIWRGSEKYIETNNSGIISCRRLYIFFDKETDGIAYRYSDYNSHRIPNTPRTFISLKPLLLTNSFTPISSKTLTELSNLNQKKSSVKIDPVLEISPPILDYTEEFGAEAVAEAERVAQENRQISVLETNNTISQNTLQPAEKLDKDREKNPATEVLTEQSEEDLEENLEAEVLTEELEEDLEENLEAEVLTEESEEDLEEYSEEEVLTEELEEDLEEYSEEVLTEELEEDLEEYSEEVLTEELEEDLEEYSEEEYAYKQYYQIDSSLHSNPISLLAQQAADFNLLDNNQYAENIGGTTSGIFVHETDNSNNPYTVIFLYIDSGMNLYETRIENSFDVRASWSETSRKARELYIQILDQRLNLKRFQKVNVAFDGMYD